MATKKTLYMETTEIANLKDSRASAGTSGIRRMAGPQAINEEIRQVMIKTLFHPPLTPAEKPLLLAAISYQWGCDSEEVRNHCQMLIGMKKLAVSFGQMMSGELPAGAFVEKVKCAACGHDEFIRGSDPCARGQIECAKCGKPPHGYYGEVYPK